MDKRLLEHLAQSSVEERPLFSRAERDKHVWCFVVPEGVLFPSPAVGGEGAAASCDLVWASPLIELANRHNVTYVLCSPHFDQLKALAPPALAERLHPEPLPMAGPESWGAFRWTFRYPIAAVQYYVQLHGIHRWMLVAADDDHWPMGCGRKNLVQCDPHTGLSAPRTVEAVDAVLSALGRAA